MYDFIDQPDQLDQLSDEEHLAHIGRITRASLQPGYTFLDADRATFGPEATREALRNTGLGQKIVGYSAVAFMEAFKLAVGGQIVMGALENLLK